MQLQKLDPNDYVASVAIVPAEFGRSSDLPHTGPWWESIGALVAC